MGDTSVDDYELRHAAEILQRLTLARSTLKYNDPAVRTLIEVANRGEKLTPELIAALRGPDRPLTTPVYDRYMFAAFFIANEIPMELAAKWIDDGFTDLGLLQVKDKTGASMVALDKAYIGDLRPGTRLRIERILNQSDLTVRFAPCESSAERVREMEKLLRETHVRFEAHVQAMDAHVKSTVRIDRSSVSSLTCYF